MSKRQTLLDIANRAGVSPRTVSNVVNGYVPVSDKLRKRVEQAVEDLGYRPNFMARSLRNGRTGLMALVVPEIDVPYFAELSRTIIEEADALGYRVMIDQTAGQMVRERAHIANATQSTLFDGIIFSPLALSPSDLADIAGSTPFVVLGEHSHGGLFDHVALDNVQAAADVIAHLHSIGRTRIAAIGQGVGPSDGTKQLRYDGYVRGLEQVGLPFDPGLVPQSSRRHRELGFDATMQLLDRTDFDALFCFSDLIAIGAMRALASRGIRVPEDVAVVGWDDIAEAEFSNPPLTSVAPDKSVLAKTTLGYLIDRMSDPAIAPRDFVVPHTLQIRESSVGVAL
ncbi:LacI family DNA-binding transcriptional regulator [Salinibacterium soli]|uniref:LacI family DNA-binding transcriptional regulator n=1 Tax=Antiquaquibacter soli TaxID=3064523 RepID=A0ABT9BUI8_9MICO|nr:LacI family DNA-binding transcriptional regulator [Protaetiibacter sp. WY-16]MDO7883075.1 LacI family DNA-binding transcriptional regulator [Protaetiibacter sp. WY-16]